MAITRNTESNDHALLLTVNNGDLEALRKSVDRLNFKDEESLLRYALAVFARSVTRNVTITEASGERATLEPNPTLLKNTSPDK